VRRGRGAAPQVRALKIVDASGERRQPENIRVLGLTDRIEPWARRFQQRVPGGRRRGGPAAALRARPAGAPDPPQAAGARARRFLRRALQQR
jgi:hypothetical protein